MESTENFGHPEVPIEDIDSESDVGEVQKDDDDEIDEEKKGEDQVDSVFDESQGNESYVPIEDRPKEFSQEEPVDGEKMTDVEKPVMNSPLDLHPGEVMLIEDSPAKAPGDESEMREEDWARVSEMIACHENIEDKISEISAKLRNAKKQFASRKPD